MHYGRAKVSLNGRRLAAVVDETRAQFHAPIFCEPDIFATKTAHALFTSVADVEAIHPITDDKRLVNNIILGVISE